MRANPDLQPSSMDSPLSLLDLPLAWLVRVLKKVHRRGRLALFRTCKTLKDVVLDSADSTRLTLQPLELKQEQMLKALELLHQHAKPVAVCLRGKPWQAYSRATALELATRCCSLLTQAQLMGYLDKVTSLEFLGAEFAMPLMPVFSESCPNLTALTLRDSIITWQVPTIDSLSAVFPKLQELKLRNVRDVHTNEACKNVQHQLAQLTVLQSLQLVADESSCDDACLRFALNITAAIPMLDQLTHLEMPWKYHGLSNWDQNGSLRSLQMHKCILKDDLMQQLLTLPNLTSLSVEEVAVEQSYRGHDCRWQQLVANSMGLEDLARLPLHSKLKIKSVPDSSIFLRPRKDKTGACIQEALDNIIASKWEGWDGARVLLRHSYSSGPCVLVEQALGLCYGAGHLTLDGATLNSTDMAALEAFAILQQQGFVLDLSDFHTMANVAGLITHMPAGSSLVLSRSDEAGVIQLCSAAQRSFALHAKQMQGVQPGAKERIVAALVKHGCTRATVYISAFEGWVVIVRFGHDVGNAAPQHDSLNWAASLLLDKWPWRDVLHLIKLY